MHEMTNIGEWALWSVLLLAQNYSFTYVSRARASGSLSRHVYAAVMSNGVWFLSQGIIFQKLFKIMTGAYGWRMALFTAAYYTVFTVVGSVLAHYVALKTEKGKSRVGANESLAQISKEDWASLKQIMKTDLGREL